MDSLRFHPAWIILIICFLDIFINFSIRLGYGLSLPEMIREIGFSRSAAATIYNSYLLVYVAATPFAGYITDRFGARWVITSCAALLGAGTLLMGTVHDFGAACLFYALAGLGASGIWTPALTLIQRWFSPRRRGLALGILSAGYGLGFAMMGAVFPWIVENANWRYSWYALGSAALGMIILNGLILRSDPAETGRRPWGEESDPEQAFSAKTFSLSGIFRSPLFWIIGVSYFLITFSLYGITTFMVDYARFELGWSLDKASRLATVHGISQVLGVLTILPLSDRLGRKKTVLGSNFVVAAAIAGILFYGREEAFLFFFIGVLAASYGVTFPLYGACAGDYFHRERIGTVIGAWTLLYGGGAMAAHWVGGFIRDTAGSYGGAFAAYAVSAFASFVLFVKVSKK
ncbi:MAG: MFS transporter [Syntrophales bacterium]|nr:MFS transporter [Syntrophales bacterium]MDD5233755.1 MFS transporter [Syntrophales bacterium]